MTPVLLAPLGLLALAALVVPLLIHLRRRTEEVPVDFAAMRWLEALPRPRRKLQLDEFLLLALRLLLVALLALLLARPALPGGTDARAVTLVASGVDPAAARRIAGEEADLRWIAPGFPDLAAAPPADAATTSLIRQFDAELPRGAALTILVPEVLDGADAAPLRLTRAAQWRIVESGAEETSPSPGPPPPALAVRHPPGAGGAVRYFEAASRAWGEDAVFEAATSAQLPPQGHVLVWLDPGPLPPAIDDWVRGGGTALLGEAVEVAMPGTSVSLWRDEAGDTLVEGGPLGSGRLMRFTRRLDPAALPQLVDGDFPARLRALVAQDAPPPARVAAAHFAPVAGAAPYPIPPRDLTPWLAVLAALLFLAERLIAARPARFAP